MNLFYRLNTGLGLFCLTEPESTWKLNLLGTKLYSFMEELAGVAQIPHLVSSTTSSGDYHS